jgi:hypothetical protein
MEKQSINIAGKNGPSRELTLNEVAEGLGAKDPLDALIAMRSGSKDLIKKIQEKSPQWVEQRFNGDTAQLEKALSKLEKINGDKLKLLNANKEFSAEVKKEGWGSWALRKVKEVVTYPIRHPFKTLGWALLAAALVAGGLYLSGSMQTAMTGPAADAIRSWFKAGGVLKTPMGEMPGLDAVGGSPLG